MLVAIGTTRGSGPGRSRGSTSLLTLRYMNRRNDCGGFFMAVNKGRTL